MRTEIFEEMAAGAYENLFFCEDKSVGLHAIIAIHSTALGPAIGGVRLWPYPDEDVALQDALRLARAMTYKCAAAGLDAGGGKTVIWGDSAKKQPEMFRSLGRFIERLGGSYVAGEDVGTTPEDMAVVAQETRHVMAHTELPPYAVTAYGIYYGIRACLTARFGHPEVRGRTFAVQGCGLVGMVLMELLYKEGAHLIAADVDPNKTKRAATQFGAKIVAAEAIFDEACDVFSPCAMGGILNDATIPRLQCAIVAGSTNNQLLEERHGELLQRRGILYAPDYVINAGGAIYLVTRTLYGEHDTQKILARVAGIGDAMARILALAQQQGIPTHRAAEQIAQRRLAAAQHSFWLPSNAPMASV
ncbi:MAG: amino acid dehydrogenase [Firmicutes bacterium]|nr:amino acid dehydrogenase [Bacillota bacterium]